MKCTECGKNIDFDKGINHKEGFICHTCIQDEHYARLDALLKDPTHKDIPIDDIFTESKKDIPAIYGALTLVIWCGMILALFSF